MHNACDTSPFKIDGIYLSNFLKKEEAEGKGFYYDWMA